MPKISYVPYDPVREEEKAMDKAERKAAFHDPINYTPEDPRFGRLDPTDPEYESVEDFVEYLFDDDRETFTHQELQCVWHGTQKRLADVRAELESFGLRLERRRKEQRFRGVSENPYTLYKGNPMAGGGGGGSIVGLAG